MPAKTLDRPLVNKTTTNTSCLAFSLAFPLVGYSKVTRASCARLQPCNAPPARFVANALSVLLSAATGALGPPASVGQDMARPRPRDLCVQRSVVSGRRDWAGSTQVEARSVHLVASTGSKPAFGTSRVGFGAQVTNTPAFPGLPAEAVFRLSKQNLIDNLHLFLQMPARLYKLWFCRRPHSLCPLPTCLDSGPKVFDAAVEVTG